MRGSRRPWNRYVFVLAGLAIGCGGGAEGPGIVNAPVVISVTVALPGTNPIEVTGTVQLSATVEVQNGASQAVEWSSSAPGVATVNQSGLVTGVTGGQTTITATSTANRTKTGSVTITVNPPSVVSVTLNSGPRTIQLGTNFAVVATVETRGPLARTVTFTTSNSTVATVATTDGLTGTITGVAAGQATITARSTADNTKSTTLVVTVTGTVRITSVTPSPVNIRNGQSVKLVPVVQADPGLSTAVTFTSQNVGIATVATDGTVAGFALGQTSIVVRSVADPTVSVSVPVTVRGGVTSVSLTPDQDQIRRGGTRQLTLQVVTETGVSQSVALTSANPAIATIDGNARVTAVAIGQTFVRALALADPAVGDSTLITVVDPCLFFLPLIVGVASGVVNDLSCNGVTENFFIVPTQQTTFLMTANAPFGVNFTVLGDKTGSWFTAANANVPATGIVIAAPNRYFLRVAAQNIAARGSFTITLAQNQPIGSVCTVVATTGITVLVPLNNCPGFVPLNRPAGTYNSLTFALLPVLAVGDRVTVTATAPGGIFPLVEVRFGTNAPVQAIGTSSTLVQQFTAPVAGYTIVTVSTRDANQTGNVTVKIEGPPPVAFDSFVFGSGVLGSMGRSLMGGPLAVPR